VSIAATAAVRRAGYRLPAPDSRPNSTT